MGLFGRNGVGKTTLLHLIAGLSEPAEGAVIRAGTIGWLSQVHQPVPTETVGDTLDVGAGLRVLARVLAGEGTPDDLSAADWTLETRVVEALNQFGLGDVSMKRRTQSLSGGQQTRLRLAALSLKAPDLIVLDEPTNNLDAEARTLVTGMIGRWPGGVVVVSHDRTLLRQMDRIVELSSLGAAVFGGNYDLYAQRKAAETVAAGRDLASAERDVGRVARQVQRASDNKARRDKAGRAFRAKNSEPRMFLDMQAARAEASAGRANRLAERQKSDAEAALAEARERVERVRALAIPMPPTELATCRSVLRLDAVTWDAPNGHRIVGPLSMDMTGPERVAVTGPNGAGKTTLLKLIVGDLQPVSGWIERPIKAALMDQDVSILRPDETLLDAFLRLDPVATPNDAHAALARFLFRNSVAHRTVKTLSGGEKLRACLACVMGGSRPPQLMILDEPTNHLDLDSILAVERALAGYDGALVVVSHDQAFLDAIGVEREIRVGAY